MQPCRKNDNMSRQETLEYLRRVFAEKEARKVGSAKVGFISLCRVLSTDLAFSLMGRCQKNRRSRWQLVKNAREKMRKPSKYIAVTRG